MNAALQDTCTHQRERSVWVESENPYTGEMEGQWEYSVEHTTKDIGIGAFQCTQCGKVMFYTGSWRGFYENGVPCPSSGMVSPTELSKVRKAMKAA